MWHGHTPEQCELCHRSLKDEPVFYDGATILGKWAVMDEKCFQLFGVGTGVGKAQKYDNKTGKKLEG